jgi:xanthine/uracil permease
VSRPALQFNRRELAGAFGDLGTDLPLLVGIILVAGLDATTVFLVFGALQVASGLWYRLPMPVQPLKAMAAIVIAGQVTSPVLMAGGLVVGLAMLVLSQTGALDWIARVLPRVVVRGIQVGLGLQLARIALTRFIGNSGETGWAMGAGALALVLLLRRNHRVPAALVLVVLGLAYAATTWPADLALPLGWHAPVLPARWPTADEFLEGALLLAVPQLALSLGNSVLATRQAVLDFFPEREAPTVRRIGVTYALMNLVGAPLGATPVCHGSGGMAGHYAFGGRTGGSVVYYGLLYLTAGAILAADPRAFQQLFPGPLLGVLLLVEAATLMALVRDQWADRRAFVLAVSAGLAAITLPYGYAVVLVLGPLAWRALAPRGAPPLVDADAVTAAPAESNRNG